MLIGERVRLRAMERDDLPTFVRWLNDPEVRHYLKMFLPLSLAEEERWFEDRLGKRDEFFFVVEAIDGEETQPIGTIALTQIDWKNRSAGMGISIGEKDRWGQGYGTEATRLLLRFAFRELNLHRVGLDVYDFNTRAIRTYEKAGLRHEGTRRQALYRDGTYRDVHQMGILRPEFVDDEEG